MSEPKVPERLKIWPIAGVVLVNLAPIAGVALWGWDAFALIFLYWLENVVIGMRTLASLIAAAAAGVMNLFGGLAFAGFFALHYGMFCYVHGIFVVTLFGSGVEGLAMFNLAGAAQALFATHPNLSWGLASIALWQAALFAWFVLRGQARAAIPTALMGAPYPRVIVLHIAILFGGAVVMALNQPIAGLVLLALAKTAFDAAEVLGKTPGFDLAPQAAGKARPGG